MDVTVLEGHVYPGGCAGTFYHKKYRFDSGATLAGGFYTGGPMDVLANAVGIDNWGGHPANPAMVVHLPGGQHVTRYANDDRHSEHRRVFGDRADAFFEWQERTADNLWELALDTPSWPPQSTGQGIDLVKKGLKWLGADLAGRLRPGLLIDAFSPLSSHLKDMPATLRDFIDGQLLISSQATSEHANALHGASALDLPRRGIVHLEGGMGAIADKLVKVVRMYGGQVIFRQKVTRIVIENGKPVAVETNRQASFPADIVIANLTPWNIAALLGQSKPVRLSKLSKTPPGWGAFMVYAGLDGSAIPPDFPLHHQVLARRPLGEGNSVFLSFSPVWDPTRAPEGKRALTISTHTDLVKWWRLFEDDPAAYQSFKAETMTKVLETAERALPGLREASELLLPGTPVTFERFTQRIRGWVGGFPQVNLFQSWGPRLGKSLWMVGDSIFPGQSTAAVALGGMRVARDILADAS